MTTRQEAAAKAVKWAQDADRHERTSREEWRQRAHEHALMWTGIAALLPEGPTCAVTFPDSISDDDRARFIAAWTQTQPAAASEPKPPSDLADAPDFELIPEWRAMLDREAAPKPCSINHECPGQPKPNPLTAHHDARCLSQYYVTTVEHGALVQCVQRVAHEGLHVNGQVKWPSNCQQLAEPESTPRLLDRTAVHAVIRFVASATGRIDPDNIELLTDHCWATCARTST